MDALHGAAEAALDAACRELRAAGRLPAEAVDALRQWWTLHAPDTPAAAAPLHVAARQDWLEEVLARHHDAAMDALINARRAAYVRARLAWAERCGWD